MHKVIQAPKNHSKIHYILYIVAFLGLFLTFSSHAVFAETVDYNVNIKPSLEITISPNPVVLNLNPASNPFGSINVNVSVGTNNPYGYQLFMNTDSNETKLNRDSTTDGVVADIPTLASSTTTSSFPANYWGYRINNNVGGDSSVIDTTSTNYYTYAPGTMISSTTTATNDNTANLTFASKIDYTKPAGSYDLTLKMKALPIVTTYYMQDIAASSTLANTVCTEEPTVVLDKRDEQAYTIRRINGTCWMVENLQFTGTTMDSTTSNIASTYTPSNPLTLTYGDLTDGNSYDEPRIHVGNITTTNSPIDDSISSTTISTVWYNYAAASAGTIVGNDNLDPQIYDICPSGWRLPNSLEVETTLDHMSEFSPVAGGSWNGSYVYQSNGYWWVSNTSVPSMRHIMYQSAGNPNLVYDVNARTRGNYVRCVMKDINLGNLTYMQDFAKITTAEKTKIINNTEQEVSYQLIDSRESSTNSYYVSKLKDGKVWMLQNLKLGNNSSSVALTSTDSNISASSWTLNGKVADGKFAYVFCVTGTCEDRYIDTSLYYDSNSYYCTPVSGNSYVGCYYNWYSATAGSGTSSITPVGTSIGYKDVSSSICPKGWYLPSGGGVPLSGSTSDRSNSDFNMLYSNYPSASGMLVSNPTTTYDNISGSQKPGFLLSGYYNDYGASGVSQISSYWSRSAYSKGLAYNLYLDLNGPIVDPQHYSHKYSGRPIRCLVSN